MGQKICTDSFTRIADLNLSKTVNLLEMNIDRVRNTFDEVSDDLSHDRAELVSMTRTGRNDQHLRMCRMAVNQEVFVGEIREAGFRRLSLVTQIEQGG